MRIRFLAVATVLCCFTSASLADLVSYWPFDDFQDELTTPDVVSGYDLEVVSTTGNFGVDNHVDGKFGKAFEFFNEDQSLLARTHDEGDNLPINLHPEWTISMWAKVDGVGQNDLRLLSESNTQGDANPLFNIGTANNGIDGSLDVYIRNNALTTPTVNHPHTEAKPFEGEWSHVGWTYAEGMHNIYINGVYDSSYEMESFGAVDPPNIDTTTIGGILRADPSHWVTGVIDDVAMWNQALTEQSITALASEATTPMDVLDFEGTLPPFPVEGRGEVGASFVAGSRANQVFGEPGGDMVPGLGQSWYAVANPGSKEAFDVAAQSNERAVPYFHSEESTWWSGSEEVPGVQSYPAEVADVITGDNYMVKLEGEILIAEAGTYRFLDGVDDFTYLAIDIDKSGVAGDSEADVLINDNTWTNALSVANGGAAIVEADFDDIAEGGEWLPIEFNMAEGGGGDHGMLYWDYDQDEGPGEAEFFPIEQGEGVYIDDAEIFMIPDSNLRGPESPAPLVSGEVNGSVPTRVSGWEIDVNPEDGTSDVFAIENPDENIFTTTLDVEGVEFHINALGEVSEGDSFKVVDADMITGNATVATEGWSFDAATGFLTFGAAVGPVCDPNTGGDIDGNGSVEFADFLVLSDSFGTDVTGGHTSGDLDCNGSVEFADFLILSNNFGTEVGAEASSVPEPSGLALFGIAGLLAGLIRRRR